MTAPKRLTLILTKEEISREVKRLAREIDRDYQGKYPLLLGILKGCFVLMADLVRLLQVPVEIDFVTLSSYGSAKVSSGEIKVVQGLRSQIKGRDILVVEDIVDTGLTVGYFMNYLRRKKPASLKLCVLFDKPSRRQVHVPIDYLGFTVPDRFLVGYGLDCDGSFRHLPELYAIED